MNFRGGFPPQSTDKLGLPAIIKRFLQKCYVTKKINYGHKKAKDGHIFQMHQSLLPFFVLFFCRTFVRRRRKERKISLRFQHSARKFSFLGLTSSYKCDKLTNGQIRRSRVAGRARTIGNRVTATNGSRVRISPSPP